jgi:hypothetical protein
LKGLNRSTISRQIARGQIPVRDGLVNPREADKARRANLDMRRGRRKKSKASPAPAEIWSVAEVCAWLMDKIRGDLVTVAPAAFQFLAAEFAALGGQAPEIAGQLAADAMDAMLSPAVDRLLPEYEWPPMPGYSNDVGEQADEILNKLQEIMDPFHPPPPKQEPLIVDGIDKLLDDLITAADAAEGEHDENAS